MEQQINWKDKINTILKENIKSCEQYEEAHNKNIIYYKKILNIGTIVGAIVILLNAILSSLIIGKVVNNNIVNIVLAILSGIIGLGEFSSFYYYNPAEKLASHIDSRNKYKQIINKIEWELIFRDNNEENSKKFTKEICKEMLELEIGYGNISIINKKELEKKKQVFRKLYSNQNILSNTQDKNDINDTNDIDSNNSTNNSTNNSQDKNDINNIIKNSDIENGLVVNNVVDGLTEDEITNFNALFNKYYVLQYELQRFNR